MMNKLERHNNAKWYAVYVRLRYEAVLSKRLGSLGVSHFLPQIERRRKWSDRYITRQEPLFPGYVFVRIAWGEHLDIVKAPGFVSFVTFGDLPPAVPDDEIEAVRIALSRYEKCDPYPYLIEGMVVTVLRGPLKGYRGVLEKKNRKHRLVLSVSLIGQSMAVEVDAADVE